jgi:hypothetical protein
LTGRCLTPSRALPWWRPVIGLAIGLAQVGAALACVAIVARLPSRLWGALRPAPRAAAAVFAALRLVTPALWNGLVAAACTAW